MVRVRSTSFHFFCIHRAISPHGFTYRSHGEGKYHTGGHNWYMTTRFDVWFINPFDGYEWHGWLITGGDNETFRVRRTQTSPLVAYDCPAIRECYPDFWQAEQQKRSSSRRRFIRRPRIEHVDLGQGQHILRVLDGDTERWFARPFADGWHYGRTIGDVFASRMLGQIAA